MLPQSHIRFSTCLLLKEASKGRRKPVCEVNRLVLDIPDSFLQENQRHGDIFCADRMVIANELLKEGFSAYPPY